MSRVHCEINFCIAFVLKTSVKNTAAHFLHFSFYNYTKTNFCFSRGLVPLALNSYCGQGALASVIVVPKWSDFESLIRSKALRVFEDEKSLMAFYQVCIVVILALVAICIVIFTPPDPGPRVKEPR